MKKRYLLLVLAIIATILVVVFKPLAMKGQDPDQIETPTQIKSPTQIKPVIPNQEQGADPKDGNQGKEGGQNEKNGGTRPASGSEPKGGLSSINIPSLEDTISVTSDGKAIVTNPNDIFVVVNKQRALPAEYIPQDLVEPNVRFSFEGKHEKKLLRQAAAEALEKLFAAAEQEQIQLAAVSGYRSYQTQVNLFEYYAQRDGHEAASRYSAWPGHSEHQTGLAMDVSSQSANFSLEELFADTVEGKWLAEHAAEYGFIIRYPKGKEGITGYTYEPWHLRYVGTELAQAVFAEQLTLEEYITQAVPVSSE